MLCWVTTATSQKLLSPEVQLFPPLRSCCHVPKSLESGQGGNLELMKLGTAPDDESSDMAMGTHTSMEVEGNQGIGDELEACWRYLGVRCWRSQWKLWQAEIVGKKPRKEKSTGYCNRFVYRVRRTAKRSIIRIMKEKRQDSISVEWVPTVIFQSKFQNVGPGGRSVTLVKSLPLSVPLLHLSHQMRMFTGPIPYISLED